MKRLDLVTLARVSGGQSLPLCDLLNNSGHYVTLHLNGARIGMANGDSQGVLQGDKFTVSSPGRKSYGGACNVVQPMGIAPDNFAHKR